MTKSQNKAKIVFFGTPKFSAEFLADLIKTFDVVLVVSGPDASSKAHRTFRQSAVKQYALAQKIPVISPVRLSSEVINKIASYHADLGVVVAYGKILPNELIDSFNKKLLNVHGSILPKYRGSSPIEAAILAGEKETGPTIMLIEPALDSGPILSHTSFAINNKNQSQVYDLMSHHGRPLLIDTIKDYLDGKIQPRPQNDALASYCGRILKADGRLDFSKSPIELERQIRAYLGWPGSFFEFKNNNITIIDAISTDLGSSLPAGHLYRKQQNLYINCKKGALEIIKLIPAGKKAMTARDFINSHPDISTI